MGTFVGSKVETKTVYFRDWRCLHSFVLDFICDCSKIKPRSIIPRSINNWFCEIYSNRFIACFDFFCGDSLSQLHNFSFLFTFYVCIFISRRGGDEFFLLGEAWKWFASGQYSNGMKCCSIDLMITRVCPSWGHRFTIRSYQPLNGWDHFCHVRFHKWDSSTQETVICTDCGTIYSF